MLCVALAVLGVAPVPRTHWRGVEWRGVRARSVSLAILDSEYTLSAPCSRETAALVVGAEIANMPDAYWVAVRQPSAAAPTADLALAFDATSLTFDMSSPNAAKEQMPAAVARLRPSLGILDQIRSTIPKEDPQTLEVLGLCIDACLLEWLRHLDSTPDSTRDSTRDSTPDSTRDSTRAQQFESLSAASTLHTAELLESRGFSELEAPDLTALGRGAPITTHAARLPASILAYTVRSSQMEAGKLRASRSDTELVGDLLEGMRRQTPPEPTDGEEGGGGGQGGADPWAGMKSLAGL